MEALPTIALVVGIIGTDEICRNGNRPHVLIHEDGRLYRANTPQQKSPFEVGEMVNFYTEGDDEPYAPSLRGFDSIEFMGKAQETELEPLWRLMHKVS